MSGFKPSFLWIALVFGALCLPLILSRRQSNYSADEAAYYLPAVRQIRAHWPALDLRRDCLSAAAPGYPYLLATLSLATGANLLPLRLATFAMSLALLWLLWRCFPTGQRTLAIAALLVLACSNFYVKSASWIVTDNAALLGMTGTLVCVLLVGKPTASGWAGALAAVTTFTRQNYVWLAAPVAARVQRDSSTRRGPVVWLQGGIPLAPVMVFGILIAVWGDVVPPRWHEVYNPNGVNLVAPLAYALAVLGCLGGFFYAAVAEKDWRADFGSRWAWVGAGLGLAIAVAGPTFPSVPAGRWGGYLWLLAEQLPTPGGRSIVFLILTPLGGAMVGALIRRLRAEAGAATAGTWIWTSAFWGLSQLPNRQVFHRYYEPAIVILLILWVLLILRSRTPSNTPRWLPLGALAVGQLVLTLVVVHYQVFWGHLLP